MTNLRHNARTDTNQRDIVKAFRQAMCKVAVTNVGGDFPDLAVETPDGRLYLVEVKTEKGKMTPGQQRFQDEWKSARVVRSVDEALGLVGVTISAEYVTHRGGNYGSPVYRCTWCGEEGMVDDMKEILPQIKHAKWCRAI